MQKELAQRCVEYAEHISGLCGVGCRVLDMQTQQFINTNHICEYCVHNRGNQVHLYGCSEAYRWNGKFIYYCPMGLLFIASSISADNGSLAGGLIVGPMIMGSKEDLLTELPDDSARAFVQKLPVYTTGRVHHFEELLCAVTAYVSGMPHSIAGSFVYEQEKMLKSLYDIKNRLPQDTAASTVLVKYEKQLQQLITQKDKSGAQQLLNELLGHIYFTSEFNFDRIKARILELIVLLSRTTIDAGADIDEILLFNTGYIKKLEQIRSVEELSVWITGIMHRFISYTFDFVQVKHSNMVYKAMEYIKSHYAQKITLDDIAQYVYFSRTYLSSIFKEETGQSLFSYINHVRVEKSKRLLLDESIKLVDIAMLCGFEDQSYFTKVFKRTTGVLPKKYRDSHGKVDS